MWIEKRKLLLFGGFEIKAQGLYIRMEFRRRDSEYNDNDTVAFESHRSQLKGKWQQQKVYCLNMYVYTYMLRI